MPRFTCIAENTGPFSDFGPYVPAINDRGDVAFTATLHDGDAGVFTGRGGQAQRADGAGAPVSHPDIDDQGSLCFYARSDGDVFATLHRDGVPRRLATGAGPLGPTMSRAGLVAFRADPRPGLSGVYLSDGSTPRLIADTSRQILAFQGLPVVTAGGVVVFRADLRSGVQALFAGRGGSLTTLVDTTGELATLGKFPAANDAETVAFIATLRSGGCGVFTACEGEVSAVETGPLESFRGALIDDRGRVVFYAAPAGGTLGVYGNGERLFGFGDLLFGSTITDFALNPVSINQLGQLAARVTLHDGRQMILRVDWG